MSASPSSQAAQTGIDAAMGQLRAAATPANQGWNADPDLPKPLPLTDIREK